MSTEPITIDGPADVALPQPDIWPVCIGGVLPNDEGICPPVVEECSTGVLNELGGCEPVGTSYEPVVEAPAVTIATVHQPATLPATGGEPVIGALAAVLVTVGILLTRLTRRTT